MDGKGAWFVQVAASQSTEAGFVDVSVFALDANGVIWQLKLGGDGWKRLPLHPETPGAVL